MFWVLSVSGMTFLGYWLGGKNVRGCQMSQCTVWVPLDGGVRRERTDLCTDATHIYDVMCEGGRR